MYGKYTEAKKRNKRTKPEHDSSIEEEKQYYSTNSTTRAEERWRIPRHLAK